LLPRIQRDIILAIGNLTTTPRFTRIFGMRRNRIMNNGKRFALRVSTMCFGIAVGALVILSLAGVAHTVRAQNPAAEKVVYNFRPLIGYFPSGVIRDAAGNLYVATSLGGSNGNCVDGCGNILKLSHPDGRATVLYTFVAPDGVYPDPSVLTRAASGNLYGTTGEGGQYSLGSVFELTNAGVEGTLYNFTGGNDGYYPSGGVTMDSAGNLYGTTIFGGGTACAGGGCGIIWKVNTSGSETILYSFTGGADGREPRASPILDSSGNLYGTATVGGDLNCPLGFGEGCGTVWKLGTAGNLTVLYTFTGGTDGAAPTAGLVMDSSGNLYGDTGIGGNLSCSQPDGAGCGVIFEIDSSGNFTVLYTFAGEPNDGQGSSATLLRDTNGNLYGTTVYGGDQSCSMFGSVGCGVVFKLDASGNETILHAFTGGTTDGEFPQSGAPLISDGKGNLYGTTQYGGSSSGGVVFIVRE
jgi:uncharacterized repeat protein (TIGR03803 family)